MPAPYRTAESPAGRRERAERPHEDENDRVANCGDLVRRSCRVRQHWLDVAVARKSVDLFSRNFRLQLISLEQKTRHGRCVCQ
jgi:hypothetical protein